MACFLAMFNITELPREHFTLNRVLILTLIQPNLSDSACMFIGFGVITSMTHCKTLMMLMYWLTETRLSEEDHLRSVGASIHAFSASYFYSSFSSSALHPFVLSQPCLIVLYNIKTIIAQVSLSH